MSQTRLNITATPLIYRLADTTVLIGVRVNEREAEPLYTEVSGEICAVAYTDPEEIKRDLPEDYRLFQITVPELLAQLPPVCGLIINPRAKSPIYIAADERDAVIAAAVPFPAGARILIRCKAENHPALLGAVLPRVEAIAGTRRVYCTRYRVADAREKILIVYDNDDGKPEADQALNDAFINAASGIQLPTTMQIVAIGDMPEELRRILLAEVEPCYVRADLREPEV